MSIIDFSFWMRGVRKGYELFPLSNNTLQGPENNTNTHTHTQSN